MKHLQFVCFEIAFQSWKIIVETSLRGYKNDASRKLIPECDNIKEKEFTYEDVEIAEIYWTNIEGKIFI